MKGTCLVTGGLGFIGSHLAQRLVSEDFDVVVLDKMGIKGKPDIRYFQGDVSNWTHWVRTFASLGEIREKRIVGYVTYLFHLAGCNSMQARFVDDVFKTNIIGTYNALCAARRFSVSKFIFVSSASVYGDAKAPQTENSNCYPKNFYAMSKAVGETLCAIFNKIGWVNTTILRPFNVYGPGQKGSGSQSPIIPAILCSLSDNCDLTIYGDGEQTRDFVFIDDMVEALFLAREAKPGTVYNVGSGQGLSINGLIRKVGEKWGAKPKVNKAKAREDEVRFSQADIERIQRALGWVPRTSLDEGLSKTIKWWREI